jgi:DNA-binding transcriptional LysR family regulator
VSLTRLNEGIGQQLAKLTDVLCPVLTEHPLRQPRLYAIYASRKYLPLKLRTFVDFLIERTRVPSPWGTAAVDISIS